jgi:hypothetical protein
MNEDTIKNTILEAAKEHARHLYDPSKYSDEIEIRNMYLEGDLSAYKYSKDFPKLVIELSINGQPRIQRHPIYSGNRIKELYNLPKEVEEQALAWSENKDWEPMKV